MACPITGWHCEVTGKTFGPEDDPGVKSVRRTYHHDRSHGSKTVVMGASLRYTRQIEALAGCDRLTISPDLLQTLQDDTGEMPRRPFPGQGGGAAEPTLVGAFGWETNEDAMATEKLAEGIRNFDADALKLEKIFGEHLAA